MASLWDRWESRLAFSTNAFKKDTLPDALAAVADAGYAGVEVMADTPHLRPVDMADDGSHATADAVTLAGLVASNVNAFTGFFASEPFPHGRPTGDTYTPTWIDDADARALRVRHTLACVRLAHAAGCRTVSLQPGGPTIRRNAPRDELCRRFAEGIGACLPLARELNVILAVEPEPGLLLETTREYLDWKHAHFPDEPHVAMNYDVGHAFCVGEDPAAVARDLAGHYAHVHLEDIAATRVHQHLVPGDGAIDFVGLFETLDDAGYDGWVTVELYPFLDDARGVARRAYKHLRRILARV